MNGETNNTGKKNAKTETDKLLKVAEKKLRKIEKILEKSRGPGRRHPSRK
jgi:hypothetical protein